MPALLVWNPRHARADCNGGRCVRKLTAGRGVRDDGRGLVVEHHHCGLTRLMAFGNLHQSLECLQLVLQCGIGSA